MAAIMFEARTRVSPRAREAEGTRAAFYRHRYGRAYPRRQFARFDGTAIYNFPRPHQGVVMMESRKAFDLTDEMNNLSAQHASSCGVVPNLHEHDQLMGYFIHHARMPIPLAVSSYYSGGQNDAVATLSLLKELNPDAERARLLEFASGYGRVTRHLTKFHDPQLITAADIHPEACTFLSNHLGVRAIVSQTSPSKIELPEQYEFIFVLSMFSHLPDATFGPWLRTLYQALAPGGHLMFTTHGEFALRKAPDFFGPSFEWDTGFGYRIDSDQADLDAGDYGCSCVAMHYVSRVLRRDVPEAEFISMRAGKWFGIQDEWIVRRPS